MKGVKRKFDDLDKIPGASNKLPKLSQPSNENENLTDGPTHNMDKSLSFIEEPSCSSIQSPENGNCALETEKEETEIAAKYAKKILQVVEKMVIPEQEARSIVEIVSNDLKNALGHLGESYNIVPFGSFINGLVCRDSDLDFFLETCSRCEPLNQVRRLLNKAAERLRKSKNLHYVCRIPKARVPIIKFTHSSVECECDLSFTNEIGVRNTLLVKFYLSLNQHLKPLVLFLKYLLELNDLHGPNKITTYMLFWLVVYYMQQHNILPPVQSVRELVSEPYDVNGWDCRVPPPFVTPVSDFLPLFSHLKAFLAFYSKFDFLYYVISPYLACPLSVNDFEDLRIPFDLFANYFRKVQKVEDTTFNFSSINLQDPTELNVNITRQVQLPALNLFRSFCYQLYILCTDSTAETLALDQALTKILPKTISKSNCSVPSDCIQSEIHKLTANRLPENHPVQKTFAVNGVLFFSKRLEKILKSKYECDVQILISDQTLRINRNREELRKKAVPVAYFRCSVCKEKLSHGEGKDKIISSGEDTSKAILFIIMDTTFGGDEIRIQLEGCASFLRYLSTQHIINLLVQVSDE